MLLPRPAAAATSLSPLPGGDDRWEWEPPLLHERPRLEDQFEARLADRSYDEHVVADAHAEHQHIALDDLVGPLVEDEPALGTQLAYGARALGASEGAGANHVLGSSDRDVSSLRCP